MHIRLQVLTLYSLIAVGAGCARWVPDTRPVPEVVAENPERIMITRRDSSTVIVFEPSLTDSMVVGQRVTPRGKVDLDSTLAVPLSNVAHISTWNHGNTNLAYGVGLAWIAMFIGGTIAVVTGVGGTQ